MAAIANILDQAVTGVSPHQQGEAIIRDVWPAVTASPGAARFAHACYRTIFFAPVGWLILLPAFVMRISGFLPGLAGLTTRYRLTNKRLMICKGMKPQPAEEVTLDQIHDVRLVADTNDAFYLSATMEIIDEAGKVIMTLLAAGEPESFRHSILQSAQTWGPLLKK